MAVVAKASDVYIPVVVLGELHIGSFRSVNRLAKNTEIENFTATCIVLEMHETLARTYAATKAALLNKGRPIPERTSG